MDLFSKWDIWWADVAFEEDLSKIKRRPVLIIDKQTACILSLKMTSHAPRKNFEGEYEIKDWQKAGLPKPTTIRVSKPIPLAKQSFQQKIGSLEAEERPAVQKIFDKLNDTNNP